ncbi:protein FAM228B isoform X5 [Anas platyrhynchos]|uniref:protein FAM228B isoform X5 n=1 Tax=Anas platyrhynchos TaxID=8839 RepID=UPI00065DF802|nr:protein FAM228B isoform X6 [Anas platyrhynchos]|eukprot:XP_012948851.1 protein FAM228B isoform X6 [Anas platyrhynchos]
MRPVRGSPLRDALTHPTMCAVSSPETPWQQRPKCPSCVTEQEQQKLWQRFPSAPARSNAANTFDCSRFFGKKNATKYWLTQKGLRHVKEVDRYLRHNDFLNLRKKEILYKKWLEDVSEPLLQKIEDKMGSQSSDEIEKRKEEQLALYLNYCKKKGYVALETYDPAEYDPFLLQRSTECWKVPCLVSIPALQDPLLEAIQRKFVETGIVKQCETGRLCSAREVNELSKAEPPLLPLSRQRMDAVAWLKIPPLYIASEAHRTRRLRVVEHHTDSKS